MKRRLTMLGLAGVLAAVIGVGLAASIGHDEPTHLPSLAAEEFYVAGPDGNALKCKGKLVKVKRSAVGGRVPPLTPAQAAKRGSEQQPMKVARCALGANGEETGAVTFVEVEQG